ncbi:MAG: polyhydroxyalkanoic acid system family protein [Myxococcaceae bacterium]|nr:polyhydroxyalkanoic acid system family protein [Myxococcaceae bacterium]
MIRAIVLSVVLVGSTAFAGGEKMHFDVPHHFSKADARARTQMMFDWWQKAYGVAVSWSGDQAHVVGRVKGIDIDAVLVVTEKNVGGEAEDPGMLVRGLARSYITRYLQKYMHPQYEEP